MEAPNGIRILVCVCVLLGGIGLAAVYWHRPARSGDARFDQLLADRPWRRLGSGITVVLSVMFVVGAWVVDIPDRPVPYAVYWIIILGLTVWLCVLAVQDAFHTRRAYNQWRAERYGKVRTIRGRARGESRECDG